MFECALLDVRSLPDPQIDAAALAGVPAWRQSYILRFRRAEDRRRGLGTWRLLERMLSERGFRAEEVTLDWRGKLQCDGIHFNLSHAGDLALCAVGDEPVGCDIEQIGAAPLEIAPRVFTAKEREYLRAAGDEAEARRRFFALWTLKESYLKMTGEGLRFDPARLEIELPALRLLRDGIPQPCALFHTTRANYEISLCSSGEDQFCFRGLLH